MSERSNEEWLESLHGTHRDAALGELRALLVRGLRAALSGRSGVAESDLEDFAQNALLKILGNVDSFRGESRFTTWAHKIAIHEAFSQLRRRRWSDVSLDQMIRMSDGSLIPDVLPDSAAGPEEEVIQRAMLAAIRQAIDEELSEKQRQALVAVRIHGVPLAEVARRMGTNRNALYKLLHDARKRLKKVLAARGLPLQDVLSAFGLRSAGERTEMSATSNDGGEGSNETESGI